MTIIVGEVETLKKLRERLRKKGVTRFKSIDEIQGFLSSFETQKSQLPAKIERELQEEIDSHKSSLEKRKQDHVDLLAKLEEDTSRKSKELEEGRQRARGRANESALLSTMFSLQAWLLSRRLSRLERNLEKTIRRKTKKAEKQFKRTDSELYRLTSRRESIVAKRLAKRRKELAYTKEVVDELYPLVSGAIGETSVVKTLKELSDDYYLINDFSIQFRSPIYNKATGDKIFSVQVDHLLVSKAGVFLLETKHWSAKSVESLDLRSPVEQIRRTSFAMFVLLNANSNRPRTKKHHWGARKIPIRNIIAMTNKKPQGEFRYVKVLSLSQLTGYIRYFDEVFSAEEAKSMFNYLQKLS